MRRIPALDGLRGLAVLLVVVHHAGVRHPHTTTDELPTLVAAYGGPYGVLLFFVLSGYLITTILLRELEQTASISLAAFYKRRARRLLPALLIVLAATPIVYGGMSLALYGRFVVLPVLTYTGSFVTASGGGMGPLTHTWSLAVEEHFYILWPALLGTLPIRRIRWVALMLAVAIGWRIYLGVAEGFTRTYWSTDGNAFALLGGCALAVVLHERSIRTARWAAPIGVGGVVAASLLPLPNFTETILWVSLPVVGFAVLAVWGCTERVKWMEWRWLRWLGTISYGLYLWHQMLYKTPWMLGTSIGVRGIALGAAAVLAAWLSWVLVEKPILHGQRLPRVDPKGRSASSLDTRHIQAGARSPRLERPRTELRRRWR